MNSKFYILLLLLFVKKAIANFEFPNYSFKYFDVKNGLKGTEVYSISQDNDGLIWLGTNNGLTRFDGYNFYEFENYQQEYKNPPIGNYRNILKHSDGNIWIATDYSGVSEFNPYTKSFKHYNPKNNSKNNVGDIATYLIKEDENKNIWFAHYFNGLSFFNFKTQTFEYLKHDPKNINSLLSNEIFSICCDMNGGIWIGYKNAGLSYYQFKTKLFKHYTIESLSGINSNNIYSIVVDQNKTLWIGSDKGISFKLNSSDKFKDFKKNELQNKFFYNAKFNTKNNLIYFVSSDGLHIINSIDNQLKIYRLYPDESSYSKKNRCTNLFFDKNNHLWIQFNQGFCIATENKIKLNKYNDLMNLGEKNRLCYFEIIKNNIIYSVVQNQLVYKNINSIENYKTLKLEMPNNLTQGDVIIYYPNQYSSYLLIKILNKILYVFDTKNQTIEKIANLENEQTISETKINDAFMDSKGNIWAIDDLYGIIRYSQKTRSWQIINPNNKKTNTDFYYYPTKFKEDKFGNIWMINPFLGIIKYENGIINHLKAIQLKEKLNNDNASQSIYYSMSEDQYGNMFFAGNGKQIDYYNAQNHQIYSFKREGCFGDISTSLHFDNLGNLWCFNQQSIYKVNFSLKNLNESNQDNFEYRTYDWKNGFEGNYFGNNFVFETNDGRLFFDSKESLQFMKPSEWEQEFHSTHTIIHKFLVNGEIYEFDQLKPITLLHFQNNIEIQFTGNSLVNAQNNIFKYKLMSFDNNWHYTTIFSPKAIYNNLSAGEYIFCVNSAGSDGIWNKKFVKIKIIIKAHFTSTIWFKTLLLILFLVTIYIVYRYRVDNIRKQEKLKTEFNKQIAELESKALRSQMNPHFVFNSLNSIQNYIVKNDMESSSKYLSKFAKLTRLIFDHSQEQFIPLKNELKALKTYVELEQFRFKNQFEFNIIIDENMDDQMVEIPPLIIQPFVENAIWHGIMHKDIENQNSLGKITINIHQKNDYLQIIITDNGIGREKSKSLKNNSSTDHQSSGMRLTKERLDILNKNNQLEITTKIIDLHDENKQAIGTQVIINIPIN